MWVKDVKQRNKWETKKLGEVWPYIEPYPNIVDVEAQHPELCNKSVGRAPSSCTIGVV